MPQPPTVAIVGASVRAAANSARCTGYRVIAADLFADADLREIASATCIKNYPEGLAVWLNSVACDGWLYTGALENYPKLVAEMAEMRPLWGNSATVLQQVRDPLELQRVLRSGEFLFPDTVAVESANVSRGTRLGIDYDKWLHKTYRGSSGSGVSLATAFDETGYWQRKILGIPGSAIFVALAGHATLLGVTRQLIDEQWTGAGTFEYSGSVGPWPQSSQVLRTLVAVGNLLAAHFQLAGLFNVDFIVAGEQVWILEVNPRYSASIEVIERATGVDALSHHLIACGALDSHLEVANSCASSERDTCHGKVVLYAKQTLTIDAARQAWLMSQRGSGTLPKLGDIAMVGTMVEVGQPILTLFAQGANDTEVVHRLQYRVAELESVLYGDENS